MTETQIKKLLADKYKINITFEPTLIENPRLQQEVNKLHPLLASGGSVDDKVLARIKTIVATDGAAVPTFYSLLSAAYQVVDQYDKAVEVLEDAVSKFPDYLPLLTQLAMRYVETDKLSQAKSLLGSDLNIKSCRSQESYHVTEIINYYHVAFLLSIKEEDFDAAESSLKVLFDSDFDEDLMTDFMLLIFTGRMTDKNYDHTYTEVPRVAVGHLDRKIRFDTESRRLLKEPLDFTTTVDKALAIDQDKLKELLVDLTDLYYYSKEPVWTAWQLVDCIVLLGLHFPDAAVPIVHKHVSREQRYLDRVFGMHLYHLSYPLYNIGLVDIDTLVELLHTEQVADDIKAVTIEALVNLAVQQDHLRQHIQAELLRFGKRYVDRIKTDEFIPTQVITQYCAETIDLREPAFLPLIEALYDADLVDTAQIGTWIVLKEEYDRLTHEMTVKHQPQDMYEYLNGDHKKRNVSRLTQEETDNFLDGMFNEDPYYQKKLEVIGSLMGYESEEVEGEYYDPSHELLPSESYELPYKRSGPKVGRNEPCPCGSGKKYKKCCL
jgi:tetratricopeptide (TPR) repeat protein